MGGATIPVAPAVLPAESPPATAADARLLPRQLPPRTRWLAADGSTRFFREPEHHFAENVALHL